MRILSFARTTAALIAGHKSVTRREWSATTFAAIRRAFDGAIARGERGLRVQAWSASPHRKGKKVGEILITSLTLEHTHTIPDSDWEAEGFAYMAEHGIDLGREFSVAKCWESWRHDPDLTTAVIRFEVVSIEPGITPEMFFPVPKTQKCLPGSES